MNPRPLSLIALLLSAACGGPKPGTQPIASPAGPGATPVEEPAPAVDPQPAEEAPTAPEEAAPEPEEPGADAFEAKHKPKDAKQPNPHLGYVPHRAALALAPADLGTLNVHFIDVGQGDSTLVECPNGKNILVDGGSGISASSTPDEAKAYLHAKLGAGMRVDTLVVTHPDRDHYNALVYLLNGVAVGDFYIVGPINDYSGPFKTWLNKQSNYDATCESATEHRMDWYDSASAKWGSDDTYETAVYGTGSSGNIKLKSNGAKYWVYKGQQP